MNQDLEMQEIFKSIIERSLNLFKRAEQQPENFIKHFQLVFDLTTDSVTLLKNYISNPSSVMQMLLTYWQDISGLLQNQLNYCLEGKAMPINDKKFGADEWVYNPFFNLISQNYLLAKKHIDMFCEKIDTEDERLARRIKFFARQYIDALSPENFVHTNPNLMAETIKSQGKNLLLGLKNFLTDIENGASLFAIPISDKRAFKIGENLAATPGRIIYRNKLMELIQYTPKTTKVKSVPLLIIPPWINKYYVLDLSAKNSLIRWLVEQGITVFAISWANPDASFADQGISEYLVEGPITAIKVIQEQLNVTQVNTLGFCIGGTLLSILLAYNKSKNISSIRSATFLATMIDFSDSGSISVFIDEKQIVKIEELMQAKGYFDGNLMAIAFNSLRASDLIWSFFIRNYLQGKSPAAFDMLFWNMDTTNMPYKMHSEYLRWMYLDNDLVKPGKININNTPIDVTKIDTPTFFVSTLKDHIAPWKTTYEGFRLMSGKKRFLLGGSGHIAGIIIPPGEEKYGYYLNSRCPRNPDDWLFKARNYTGSWWPEWLSWLKKESGRLIKAPDFSKLPIKAIMNAPGSYVHQSSIHEHHRSK